jgi:hypothetical protein
LTTRKPTLRSGWPRGDARTGDHTRGVRAVRPSVSSRPATSRTSGSSCGSDHVTERISWSCIAAPAPPATPSHSCPRFARASYPHPRAGSKGSAPHSPVPGVLLCGGTFTKLHGRAACSGACGAAALDGEEVLVGRYTSTPANRQWREEARHVGARAHEAMTTQNRKRKGWEQRTIVIVQIARAVASRARTALPAE